MSVGLGHFAGKRVVVTGDTGFIGSWLCLWLVELGAEVIGVALPPKAHNVLLFVEAAPWRWRAPRRSTIVDTRSHIFSASTCSGRRYLIQSPLILCYKKNNATASMYVLEKRLQRLSGEKGRWPK